MGLRPVVEFQFADFISCAFDQIINVVARHHYRTGDAMPIVFRCPFGARLRAGPTHSQSIESYFAHVPGLKLVAPATPQDAAGLLVGSIRDKFAGNGRAMIIGDTEGMVKVVAQAGGPVLGVHIAGPWASELLAEGYMAVNWQALPAEVGAFIHPHPSLSEAIGETMLALTGRSLHG
jgi:hypothetical protein